MLTGLSGGRPIPAVFAILTRLAPEGAVSGEGFPRLKSDLLGALREGGMRA
jgi:hypothetical protein